MYYSARFPFVRNESKKEREREREREREGGKKCVHEREEDRSPKHVFSQLHSDMRPEKRERYIYIHIYIMSLYKERYIKYMYE